jgi:hypothetical protein
MERQSLRKKFNKMIPMPNNTAIRKAKPPKVEPVNIETNNLTPPLYIHWNGAIHILSPVEPPKKKTVATKEIRLKPEVKRNRDKLLKELMTSKLKRRKQLSHK